MYPLLGMTRAPVWYLRGFYPIHEVAQVVAAGPGNQQLKRPNSAIIEKNGAGMMLAPSYLFWPTCACPGRRGKCRRGQRGEGRRQLVIFPRCGLVRS